MPIVLRLQSLVEAQLEGIGPPEFVSCLAEFFVAVCLFGPVIALAMIASWLVRKGDAHRAAQLHRRSTR